ncbi:hypothetical protein BGW39_005481, partial [Mortierella sp. 14UC]
MLARKTTHVALQPPPWPLGDNVSPADYCFSKVKTRPPLSPHSNPLIIASLSPKTAPILEPYLGPCQDNNDNDDFDGDEDGDNAEIVSLSSILNQGPEFKLQWHAVSQDLDLDPNVDTYPYPYTYPIPYLGASVIATGSETAAAKAAKASSSTQRTVETPRVVDDDNMNLNHLSTRSSSSIASGSGSNQPHASLLSQSRTTVTVSTAKATATNTTHNHNHNHNDHSHTLSLSALPHSDDTLCDKSNDRLNTTLDKTTSTIDSNNGTQQDEDNKSVQLSPRRIQSLDPLRQSFSQQDLIGSASTVFEHDLDDSDDELRGPSDRKMDLIAALGIADLPDRAPSPGPQDIPFSFFTEEPTFHAFQDPTSSQLFNVRRYTTDGHSKGKEARRPWMDQTDEAVVHLPQDFFDRYGPSQQDLDLDGLGDDFDVEFEHEELPRSSSRRLGKRLSLGATMAGYSGSGAYSGGHAVSTNSTMMMNLLMPSAPDEDVAHLSPIPFSELPSLTNIGLCSQRIVKLSSNIRLLSSTTCLQICCNDLCAIPPEIGFLRNLTLLDLSKNSLMNIPDSIRFLTKLVDLRLSGNFIDSLPPSIGELTKLTHLSVENNQLKRLPRQLGQLKALTHLVLDDNPIAVLPAEVGQLQYLRRLKLERCPLVQEFVHSPVHSPPTLMELAARVILRQGVMVPPLLPPHLKAYLRTSQRCSFCDGPYFESFVKRGKMIDKNEFLVPLEYTL